MNAAWLATLLAAALQSPISDAPAPEALEREHLLQLLTVRRVYVDRFGGGETAAHIREMVLSSLHSAKLFVVTENPERADAFLRGSAEDLVFTETFASSEGLDARGSFGTGSTRTTDTQGRRTYASVGVGEHESTRIAERRHEATAAVRLVNKDGDVIWATTQESQGGKFRGAAADVADKITRQLLTDYERAKRLLAKVPEAMATPKATSRGGGASTLRPEEALPRPPGGPDH